MQMILISSALKSLGISKFIFITLPIAIFKLFNIMFFKMVQHDVIISVNDNLKGDLTSIICGHTIVVNVPSSVVTHPTQLLV